jgi:hypothetical protein
MNTRTASGLACTALSAIASVASAKVIYTTVALSGQQAPGTPTGVNYVSFFGNGFSGFSLNDAGHVAFQSWLDGPGVTEANRSALFAGPPGSLMLVARPGDPAPGFPTGVNFQDLGNLRVNDAGQVAFGGGIDGPGVTPENDQVLFAGPPRGLALVAREGSPAPGTQEGVVFGSYYFGYSSGFSAVLNNAGDLAFNAILDGPGVIDENNGALFAGPPSALALIAREGIHAPGTPEGVVYRESFGFRDLAINNAGHVAFTTFLDGPGVVAEEPGVFAGVNNLAVYAGPPGALFLVARAGSPAPDTAGANYRRVSLADLNDAGQVAFSAALEVVTGEYEDVAIYAGPPDSPALIARRGDPAPGTPAGVIYRDIYFKPLELNEAGEVAFQATLAGTGVNSTNNEAIFAGSQGALRLVAREGSSAPGTAAAVSYDCFAASEFNDAGQVAFLAALHGRGVTDANDEALFVFDPVLGTQLIARAGDLFDVGGGDLRRIDDFGDDFPDIDHHVFYVSFNSGANGQLLFDLPFTDGSRGLFLAMIVPEPSTVSTSLVVAVMVCLRRRVVRRRRHHFHSRAVQQVQSMAG